MLISERQREPAERQRRAERLQREADGGARGDHQQARGAAAPALRGGRRGGVEPARLERGERPADQHDRVRQPAVEPGRVAEQRIERRAPAAALRAAAPGRSAAWPAAALPRLLRRATRIGIQGGPATGKGAMIRSGSWSAATARAMSRGRRVPAPGRAACARRLPEYAVESGFLEFARPIMREGLDRLRAQGRRARAGGAGHAVRRRPRQERRALGAQRLRRRARAADRVRPRPRDRSEAAARGARPDRGRARQRGDAGAAGTRRCSR